MVVPRGVDGEDPYEFFAVVQVDEGTDLDHSQRRSGPPAPDVDLASVVGEYTRGRDFAKQRVGWVHRLATFVHAQAGRRFSHRCGEAVPLGRGDVADALVRPLTVVVMTEPIKELLQVHQVKGRSLLNEPGLERLVEPLQLPEGLRMVGPRVDELDTELTDRALELHLHAVQTPREAQPVV